MIAAIIMVSIVYIGVVVKVLRFANKASKRTLARLEEFKPKK